MATQPAASGILGQNPPALPRRNQAGWPGRSRRTRTGTRQRAALATRRAAERDELIVKLLGLVKRVALEMREHLPAHVDVDDLVSAGTLGLMDAVRRFDAGKHVKIETYARYRIRGAILDALRNLDPASRDMRRKNKKAEQVFRELEAKLGRPATDAEMAQALHISLKEWYRTVHQLQSMGVEWLRPMQMASTRQPEEDELPAVGQQTQFDLCYREEKRAILNRALARVSERERLILSLYYERDLTMKEIGEELGIDESRVSQIHSNAVQRLRTKVQSMMRPPFSSAGSSATFAAQP
jgi:RNA polymerase sigma factor FliA